MDLGLGWFRHLFLTNAVDAIAKMVINNPTPMRWREVMRHWQPANLQRMGIMMHT